MNCKHGTCPLLGISLIPLTQGKYAIVDTKDYDWLMQWKWRTNKIKRGSYAAAWTPMVNGKRKGLLMHRLVMRAGKGQMVDHRDGNGLNNYKGNLRFCNNSQNMQNQKVSTCSSKLSQYKGVSRRQGKWDAYIKNHGKHIHLGRFVLEIDAARAYNEKAIELFDVFARLNNV